jgi:hypothetical protein
MKNLLKTAAATACLTLSFGAFAAKPTSITFESEGTAADGTSYAHYVVKCSNGQQQPLTAWDNRKNWCVGKDSKEDCHRKQIRAAKQACK